MRPRRPGIITTLAILNIIFGCLFSLCTLDAFTQKSMKLTVNNRDVTQEFKDFMKQQISGYATYEIVFAVTTVALAVGFIVAGIGMLQLAPWGRITGLVFAGLAILHQMGKGLYQLLAVHPAVTRFFGQFGPLADALGIPLIMVLDVVIMVMALIAVGYNILVILALVSNSSARAFRRAGRVEDEFEDEEDEDWDNRRPRRRRPVRDQDDDDEEPRRRRRPGEDEDAPPRRRPTRPQPRDAKEDDEDEGDSRYRSPRRGR